FFGFLDYFFSNSIPLLTGCTLPLPFSILCATILTEKSCFYFSHAYFMRYQNIFLLISEICFNFICFFQYQIFGYASNFFYNKGRLIGFHCFFGFSCFFIKSSKIISP